MLNINYCSNASSEDTANFICWLVFASDRPEISAVWQAHARISQADAQNSFGNNA